MLQSGLQIFFKIGGLKCPMEQKMVGHFLKWWAQAYKHSWHLSSMLYLHTDRDTWMHICILIAHYTVKPVLSGHLKKKTNYRLMLVRSIAECSKGSILQYFWPSLSYLLLLRSLFCLFLSGCLRQVLLYWQPTCTFCRFAVRWTDFFTTKKDGSVHWAHCLGKWWAIFSNHGTMTRAQQKSEGLQSCLLNHSTTFFGIS